jgi:hypothetical protein
MGGENKCEKCGYWKPVCKCDGTKGVAVQVFKPMMYTDICETPLWITSKRQLREECKKHNVMACRLM